MARSVWTIVRNENLILTVKTSIESFVGVLDILALVD